MLRFFEIFFNIRPGRRAAVLFCALILALPSVAAAADVKQSVGGKPGPAETGQAAVAAPDLKFDVQVSTGSGSASNAPETAPMPLAPIPADEVKAETPGAAAPADAEDRAETSPAPASNPQPAEDPAAAAETPDDSPATERRAIFEAMDAWRQENSKNYNYNITALYDPFMPIKEVRGSPNEMGGDSLSAEEFARLPKVLQLELSQLQLVAITSMSGRGDGSLASFEDGAGSSYILRQNDRIGRRNGRIVKIEPNQVTVEEEPKGASTEPEITVKKLNVLDNSGLSYVAGGNPEEAAPGALSE